MHEVTEGRDMIGRGLSDIACLVMVMVMVSGNFDGSLNY